MRQKITTRTIQAALRLAQEGGKGVYLWDSELRGFGLWASPKGSGSWLAQKWVGGASGRPVRLAFDQYPHISLEDARRKAATLISEIGNGTDIVSRKELARKAKAEAIQAPTLGEAIQKYIERNRKPGRYWSELEATFNREVIPVLGTDTRVSTITKAELQALLDDKQTNHPGAARTLYAALSPFLKWCISRDIIGSSPLSDIQAPKLPTARDRTLTEAELKAFWLAASDVGVFGPFYRLLLLTGQRREEVSGIQYSEIDMTGGTWLIPKERTKNGKSHLVHLAPQAMAIINSRPPFIGPGIVGYSKGKARLDKVLPGMPPWRIHDLRRTAASGMAQLGFQPHIIERVLNHISGAQGGLVGVYQRYEYLEERKRALEAWGAHVQKLVTGESPATNVIQAQFGSTLR